MKLQNYLERLSKVGKDATKSLGLDQNAFANVAHHVTGIQCGKTTVHNMFECVRHFQTLLEMNRVLLGAIETELARTGGTVPVLSTAIQACEKIIGDGE